jgi:hypothetical protein
MTSLNGKVATLAVSAKQRVTGLSRGIGRALADLKEHHPDLAQRVVGTIVVNEQHMTEDQLLAQARSFYAMTKP